MIELKGQPILATLLSICLSGQPLLAAVDSEMRDADLSAGTSEVQTTPSSESEEAPRAQTTRVGDLVLPKTPMTMDFQDADVRDVLHLLAVKSGLNIIYGSDVLGPVSVHLDRVPFDQAFHTILTLKALVALPMGPKVIRVVTSTALTTEQSQATTFTRVFRLNYATAEEVKKPIDAIRSSAGRKGVSTVDKATNSIIITDTQEGLKEVEDLIPILDKKPQQVDIESKIVEVTLDDETQTGISWQYAVQNKGGDSSIGSSNTSETTIVPGSGGYLPVAPFTTYTDNQATAGTGVNLPGSSMSSVALSLLTQKGAYLLGAQLTALANKGRVKILSTPHIVTINNEEAKIEVASQYPYYVSTLSGSGASQQSVQFITAGVKLNVKPTVNADRRITLKVRPEVSDASVTATGAPPQVNTRNADTTVILKDGETIAIGGLIKENTTKTVSGIPFLMNIPILGYLFKTTDDRKQRTELIVFLTPKITAE
ncbi:MAG: type IV pilus secretin PilQ [Elusimicrobiota bacterium]|jgi:type IV pilus assembly protein PilQ